LIGGNTELIGPVEQVTGVTKIAVNFAHLKGKRETYLVRGSQFQ